MPEPADQREQETPLWAGGFIAPMWLRWTLTAAAVAACGLMVKRAGERYPELRDGTAEEYWFHMCGVELGRYAPPGKAERPLPGWCVYRREQDHGKVFYRVPIEQADALVPAVVQALDVERYPSTAVLRRRIPADADTNRFFADWDAAFAEYYRGRFICLTGAPRPVDFRPLWTILESRSRNLRFEFAWLGGLIVFAAWPWLSGGGRRAWAVRFSLIPPLLMLPHYLGYAPGAFQSSFGPGHLYRDILHGLQPELPWTAVDALIVSSLPNLFGPPLPAGSTVWLTGAGAPGPVGVCAFGLAAAALFVATARAFERLQAQKLVAYPCRPQAPEADAHPGISASTSLASSASDSCQPR